MTTQLTTEGTIKIRSMESEDSGAIIDLHRMLAGAGMTTTLTSLLTKDIKESLVLSFVAEFNNQVVGFVLARRAYIGTPVIEVSLIQSLLINPLHQGRDIETRLVEALIEHSKLMGINTMRVILNVSDPRMEAFFSTLNFRRVPVVVYDKTL